MVVPGSTLAALSIFYTTHSPILCCHCSSPGMTASLSATNTSTAATVIVDRRRRLPPSTAVDVVLDCHCQPPLPPPLLLSTAAIDRRCHRRCPLATAALCQATTTLVIEPLLTHGNGRHESTAVSAAARAGKQQGQRQHCHCLWGGC